MLRVLAVLALLLAAALPSRAAHADELARIRADGRLHCTAGLKPGIAYPDGPGGKWYGLAVDICRAVATATLGGPDKIVFHALPAPSYYAALRQGADPLMFLTTSEILANKLTDAVLPGPAVFFRGQQVAVREDSPIHGLADLAGKTVCAEPGTEEQRSLEAWFAGHHLQINYFPFQEQEEMLDAFQSRICDAIANDSVRLAALRADGKRVGMALRILPEMLSVAPVYAVTPGAAGGGDPAWAATVAWVIGALQQADQGDGDMHNGMMSSLGVVAPELGLDGGWQARVLAATGNYAAIYRRNVGADSALQLDPGMNAASTQGGLFVPPHAE